jgi:hypothetical protein
LLNTLSLQVAVADLAADLEGVELVDTDALFPESLLEGYLPMSHLYLSARVYLIL